MKKTNELSEPNDWLWDVDDRVLKCKPNRAEPILDHLNSIEPELIVSNKSTKEEDNKLPILDLGLNVNKKKKKNWIVGLW